MANYEKKLIDKVLSAKDLDRVTNAGVGEQHFFNEKNREIFGYIKEYYSKYSDVPPVAKVKTKFRDYDHYIETEPLPAIIDSFVEDYGRKLTTDFLRQLAIEVRENPSDMAGKMYDMANTLSKAIPSPSVAKFSDMEERIKEYERKQREGDIYGIKTGFPTIDEITLGFQPTDYITVCAFLGVGKSQMGMFLCAQAYLQGKTPMFISLEMGREAIFRRLDAYAAEIKYNALKRMELGGDELDRWRVIAQQAKDFSAEKDIIVIDDIRNCTVDKVQNAIKRYEPDLTVVDYVSLMQSPTSVDQSSSYARVQAITRGLKQVARTEKRPIIGIAQLNREAGRGNVELTSMADSISIAQDSDIVIALSNDEEMKEAKEMDIKLLKARDGKTVTIRAKWDLENAKIAEKKLGVSDGPSLIPIPEVPDNPHRQTA